MRGGDLRSEALFSYLSCEARVPLDHPLRPIQKIVDEALGALTGEFEKLYAKLGRPSIPPEKLLRAERPEWVDLSCSLAVRRASGIVKGFRMPASHCARGCTEAGVRKASKEETAGGVCAGGSVGLWGFKARFCATWPLSDGTAGLNG